MSTENSKNNDSGWVEDITQPPDPMTYMTCTHVNYEDITSLLVIYVHEPNDLQIMQMQMDHHSYQLDRVEQNLYALYQGMREALKINSEEEE